MPVTKKIPYKGKEYTCAELESMFHIPRRRIRERYFNCHWTIEETLELEPHESDTYKTYELYGNMYSVSELEEKYSVDKANIRARVNRGWTVEEAVGLKKHYADLIDEPVICEGIEYRNYNALSEKYDVDASLIRGRIHKGWTSEEAVELVKRRKRADIKEFVIQGKTYYGYEELSKKFGLARGVVQSRLKYGADIRQAVGLDPLLPRNEGPGPGYKMGNIKVSRIAYTTNIETFYECIDLDNKSMTIRSKTELYDIYHTTHNIVESEGE